MDICSLVVLFTKFTILVGFMNKEEVVLYVKSLPLIFSVICETGVSGVGVASGVDSFFLQNENSKQKLSAANIKFFIKYYAFIS